MWNCFGIDIGIAIAIGIVRSKIRIATAKAMAIPILMPTADMIGVAEAQGWVLGPAKASQTEEVEYETESDGDLDR